MKLSERILLAFLIGLIVIGMPRLYAQFGGGGSYGQCAGDMTGTYPACTLAIVRRQTSTIAGLPACAGGTKGYMYLVSNALLPVALATVASGGAVNIGVTCDGSNWIVQ